MADYKISQRYASSLLETSVEKNKFDEVVKDMELILKAFDESPELKRVVQNPVIKLKLKSNILDEIFKSKISDETLNFIHFIINKNREEFLYSITKRFLELKDERLGIIKMKVITAFELTGDQKKQLVGKFENYLSKKIQPDFSVDKNIIGGFTAKAGDTVYDASVKHQLELLKKQFLENGFSLN